MRKLSRRTTILLVALGVLLTASIAFAAIVDVAGSTDFTVQAEDVTPDPLPLQVDVARRPNTGTGPVNEVDFAKYRITVTNPNENEVTLGETPVTFALAGGNANCTLEDDIVILPRDLLADETIPGTESDEDNFVEANFRVRLAENSGDDCDGLTLTFTVTVNGSIDDGTTAVEGATQAA